MTKLGIARIVGECGVTGGCITGGTYAAKYSREIVTLTKDKNKNTSKTVTSEEVKSMAGSYYLLIKYLLSEKPDAIKNIKSELEKVYSCIYSYAASADGKNCAIQPMQTLYKKIEDEGVKFN